MIDDFLLYSTDGHIFEKDAPRVSSQKTKIIFNIFKVEAVLYFVLLKCSSILFETEKVLSFCLTVDVKMTASIVCTIFAGLKIAINFQVHEGCFFLLYTPLTSIFQAERVIKFLQQQKQRKKSNGACNTAVFNVIIILC